MSYKGLRTSGGTCVFDKNCQILIKGVRAPKGNGTLIETVIWTIALKKPPNDRQVAKVAFTDYAVTSKKLDVGFC